MKKNLLASVLLCLMLFISSAFADGDTGNGGRSCDPATQQCRTVESNSTTSTNWKVVVLTVFSQIVALVK